MGEIGTLNGDDGGDGADDFCAGENGDGENSEAENGEGLGVATLLGDAEWAER